MIADLPRTCPPRSVPLLRSETAPGGPYFGIIHCTATKRCGGVRRPSAPGRGTIVPRPYPSRSFSVPRIDFTENVASCFAIVALGVSTSVVAMFVVPADPFFGGLIVTGIDAVLLA